ncbi:MAG: sodium-dependent transporter [Candidatus Algichlamydia australiensis]|nr:sodium-dependent transporter [Chlamydiales bacterium]
MKREEWKSRLGFIWAAVGSAVGLGNIWRFPYVVGENGGALFVLLYLLCLAAVAFPILVAEILIGRKAKSSPFQSFKSLGRSRIWGLGGKLTIVTGFLVSSFYGVIAGWTLGYLVQAFFGNLTNFTSGAEAVSYFEKVTSSPFWSIGTFFLLMGCCYWILSSGVKKGIEGANKVMMPLLMFVLLLLAFRGLLLPGGTKALKFLFSPDFSQLSGKVVLMALGQAFFSLSLGQGTMVTYGSYLSQKENVTTTTLPIALFGIFISIFAGMAIFSIVFTAGGSVSSGEGLMFETLPVIFSKMHGGYFFCLLFFGLIFMAGLTSQISALEPLIAYLVDEKRWKRKRATLTAVIASFAVGIPSALSFGPWKEVRFFGKNFFEIVSGGAVNLLIPIGGLLAALFAGWRWGLKKSMAHLHEGADELLERKPFIESYLRFTIKYLAPLIIIIILFDQLI